VNAKMIPNVDGTYPGALVSVEVRPEDTTSIWLRATSRDGARSGWLTPAEARQVAQHLLRAADVAEYNRRTQKSGGA